MNSMHNASYKKVLPFLYKMYKRRVSQRVKAGAGFMPIFHIFWAVFKVFFPIFKVFKCTDTQKYYLGTQDEGKTGPK